MSRSDEVAILGTGMTDMGRRDLSPRPWPTRRVHEALVDAAVDPTSSPWSSSATPWAAGSRPGCIRGQSWLRKSGLGDVPVVNVDNSCAGGTSALHLANMAARPDGPSAGGRGREDVDRRPGGHAGGDRGRSAGRLPGRHARPCPGGGQPGGQHPHGAQRQLGPSVHARAGHDPRADGRGSRQGPHECAAGTRWPRCSRRPRWRRSWLPQVAGVLTRLMCSSFTDGAAAVILAPGGPAPAGAPRIIGAVGRSGNGSIDYHDRLAETAAEAWEASGVGPEDFDLVELHDATSAEEIFALESLGLFAPGEAGPATWPATPASVARFDRQSQRRPGGPGPPAWRDRSRARSSSWPPPRGRRRAARCPAPGWGGRQHRGLIRATPALVGITPWRGRSGAGHHRPRLRHLGARQGGHKRGSLGAPRHERRLDHREHRHQAAPRRRHHLRDGDRGRPAALDRPAMAARTVDMLVLATTTPDAGPGHLGHRPDGARAPRAAPST